MKQFKKSKEESPEIEKRKEWLRSFKDRYKNRVQEEITIDIPISLIKETYPIDKVY